MDRILKAIDSEIALTNGERARLTERLANLRKARTALAKTAPAPAKAKRARRARSTTAEQAKAGPAAIEKVKATLVSDLNGRATQARLTSVAGLNSGQVSAALRHLTNEGVIRPTGNKEGRSLEYEVVTA